MMILTSWLEKKVFEKSLTNTTIFRNIVRPSAYRKAEGDPESVHEMALETLNRYEKVIEKKAYKFFFHDLKIIMNGREVIPFGTAAGLDKNALALKTLSYLFGYQTFGTVIVPFRKGNARPRVAVDEKNEIIYNAQGFPHNGLTPTLERVKMYREQGGDTFLIASVCGIPPSAEELNVAYSELELLVNSLNPFVQGFEWNPFSPNTAALAVLRTPEVFKKSASIIAERAQNKLRLVKMGPYEDNNEQRNQWLSLAQAWLSEGGQGITAVNTYMVSKDKVPSKQWGYTSAGASNVFLQEYCQRAITDARKEFPKAFISATGGINSGREAWKSFEAGANTIQGYSPYTFDGFGLLIKEARYILAELSNRGYITLERYQKAKIPRSLELIK